MIDEKLMQELADLCHQQEKVEQQQEQIAENFWNSFTTEQQMLLFYAVMKKVAQAALYNDKSYRGVLYDEFKFDKSAYGLGMSCGFFDLYNKLDMDKRYK